MFLSSGDNGAQFTYYSGTYSDFRFNGYSNTFYGNTYDWYSGSDYISGSVSIPSWADIGYYDVQVYDYNTWSWLTLNDGFYESSSQPSNQVLVLVLMGVSKERLLMFI